MWGRSSVRLAYLALALVVHRGGSQHIRRLGLDPPAPSDPSSSSGMTKPDASASSGATGLSPGGSKPDETGGSPTHSGAGASSSSSSSMKPLPGGSSTGGDSEGSGGTTTNSETSADTDFDDATEFTDDIESGVGGGKTTSGENDDDDGSSSSSTSSQPNILMIIVDDQGHGDIDLESSLTGKSHGDFHTPTLATLAQEGVKLSNFYSACTCTPARAMLLTGRYTIRYGFQDSVLHATEPRGVPLSEVFLGEKLQSVGYSTVMIGKWHLGMHTDAYIPLNRGFDSFYGILTGGGSHTKHISVSQQVVARGQSDKHTFSGANLWENDKFSPDNAVSTHSTVLYSTKAMNTIQHLATTDATKPWFVYLAFQAIHDPIEVGDEKFITETKCNAIDGSTPTGANRKIMCGMMAEVDDGVRQLHSQLVTLKVWEQTVIFYASDNGGLLSHGSSNAPFNGQKGTYFEGGVHVSAFLSGGFVSKVLNGAGLKPFTLKTLSHVTDFHTTACHLAGYGLQDMEGGGGLKLDGVNLWTSLTSGENSTAALTASRTEVLINLNSELFGDSGALRVGDYKLLINPDPSESTIYMQVKAHLQAQLVELSPEEIVRFAKTQTKIIVNGKRHVYNVVLNNGEADVLEGCAQPEACSNLAGNPDFADLEAELMAKFEAYKIAATPSTFGWQDDGAIANPMFFDNLWSPWRDADGAPKMVYTGLLKGIDESLAYAGSGAAYDQGATAAAEASDACEKALSGSSDGSCSRGMLSISQSSAGEVLTALALGAAVLALVGLGAFRAGKRRGEVGPLPASSFSLADGGGKYVAVAGDASEDMMGGDASVLDRKEGPLLF